LLQGGASALVPVEMQYDFMHRRISKRTMTSLDADEYLKLAEGGEMKIPAGECVIAMTLE
jgi:hypothetical protein